MKIICIGRNFAQHAAELNNEVPEFPLVFMKPGSALLINEKPFFHPEFTSDVHHEIELVVKIGKNGKHIQPEHAASYVTALTVGIDFTARDVQSELKKKGYPWEIAKAFDSSAVVGKFISVDEWSNSANFEFELHKNGQVVQQGNVHDMIFGVEDIICHVSQFFKLGIGDLIYTGTPSGVGAVKRGDRLEGFLNGEKLLHCDVK